MSVYEFLGHKQHSFGFRINTIPPVPWTGRNATKGTRANSELLKISSARVCFQPHHRTLNIYICTLLLQANKMGDVFS